MDGFSVLGLFSVTPVTLLIVYGFCLIAAGALNLWFTARAGKYWLEPDPSTPRRVLAWSALLFIALAAVVYLASLIVWMMMHFWTWAMHWR